MAAEKKKPGPEPETFKVSIPFEKALKAALETGSPEPERKQKTKRKRAKPS